MEFEGRIIRVLPTRSGTSQNGNEWKRLPVVFAYYENPDQRWEDKVLLETWDTNLMAQIAKYCEIGQDGKVVIENGSVKLNTFDIKCKCGFSHSVKDISKKDGSGTVTMNDLKCYKLDINAAGQQQVQQPAYQPQPQVLGGPQTPPHNPSHAVNINQEGGKADDLPF